jgi:hypothetical protein
MNKAPGDTQFAAAGWFKSSYSAANNECVEVAHTQSWVWIRDSKAPVRGVVAMGSGTFVAFVNGAKAGPDAHVR